MARNPEVKVTFKAFNKDFNKAISEMNAKAKTLRQEMKLQSEQMKHSSSESTKLQARLKGLNNEYEIARQKTRHTAQELEKARRLFGENSNAVKQMESALKRAQIAEQQLANRIIQTSAQLKKVQAAEKSRNSELSRSTAKLTDLKTKHDQLKATMQRMNAEYDLQKSKLSANASEAEKLRLKTEHLGKAHRGARLEIKNLENQLTQAKTKYAGNSSEIEKYRTALLKAKSAEQQLASEITATNAKLREQSSAALQASQSMNTAGTKIQSAGATMMGAFAPVGVASGMAFKRMIGGSIEFEQATRRAATLTGGEYDKIKKSVLDMAKESVYSTGEVATAFADMGQKGFSAAQATDALPGVLSAAAASGEDLVLVSDTITSALNAYNLEASESGRISDILAQGANQSAASVENLSHVFKYAAAPANQLGISIEELTASAGLMMDAGIEGSKAGTALRSSLLRLVKPTANAQETLDELGVEITNAEGEMNSLSDIVRDLESGMGDYTDTQKAAALETIFGKEAVSGMLTLISSGPDEIEKMTKALEDSAGASQEASDQMLEGWAGAMVKASSAADVAARTLTDSLAPALEKAADIVYFLSEKFASMPQSLQTAISATFAITTVLLVLLTIGGLIANSFGAIIQLFGSLGTTLFGTASSGGALTGVLNVVRGALSALLGPVGIVIAIITALIALFVRMYKTNDEFRERVNTVWDAIKERIGQAIEAIKVFITDVFGQVVDWWKENQESIKEATSNVWTWIQAFLSFVFDAIVAIFKFVWPVIQFIIVDTWNAIKNVIQGALNIILGLIDFFVALFTGDWKGLWEAIKQILSGAVQLLWGLVNLWFVGKILKIGKTFINLFKGVFSKGWSTISGIFTRSVTGVRNVVSTGFNAIRNVTSTVMNAIRTVISTIWNGIRTVISNVVNGIRSTISSRFNAIKSIATTVFNAVKNAMTRPVTAARDTIKTAIDKIKGFFSGMKLKFPKIQMPKLPKFSLKGEFSLKPPSVPKIGVSWNAKGGIFKRPTIFNTANAGLQGVGEAGPEAILPLSEKVLGTIGKMIALTMPNYQQEIIIKGGDVYLDGHRVGGIVWKPVKENIDRHDETVKRFKG